MIILRVLRVLVWRPRPHEGVRGDATCGSKTPLFTVPVGQPPSRSPNGRPIGNSRNGRISGRSISSAIYFHLNPKKNIKKFTFSDLRGYPEDRRHPPTHPGSHKGHTGTRKVFGTLGKVHKQHVALRLPTDHSSGRFQDGICTPPLYA